MMPCTASWRSFRSRRRCSLLCILSSSSFLTQPFECIRYSRTSSVGRSEFSAIALIAASLRGFSMVPFTALERVMGLSPHFLANFAID